MNRKDFCKHHWEYYLVLEKDFLQAERYVSFELGENYLYDGIEHNDSGNSTTFSDEFIKLSDVNKEYLYTLTEDAAPVGFEIAESVQFKVQEADESVCLFVRENADAEWVRADKRVIQMTEAILKSDNVDR